MQKLRRDGNGFHLIEILTTLAIASILTALSFPLYSNYLQTTRRIEAATSLNKLALALEQYYAEHNSYQDATLTALHFPQRIAHNSYQLSIKSDNAHDYRIMAAPLGKQAQKDTACGKLILYASGRMAISGSAKLSECW